MNRLAILLVVLSMLVASQTAALPGTLAWLNHGTSDEVTHVSSTTVSTTFGPGASDSKIIRVNSRTADFCFLPDTLTTGGAARIILYRALTTTPSDTARITLPAITFSGDDCDVIVNGTYWFEISTPAGSGETALATITGR